MGGLSLKFKTEARSAEVLNFNERPPIRLLSYIYIPINDKTIIILNLVLVRYEELHHQPSANCWAKFLRVAPCPVPICT